MSNDNKPIILSNIGLKHKKLRFLIMYKKFYGTIINQVLKKLSYTKKSKERYVQVFNSNPDMLLVGSDIYFSIPGDCKI